ncbi:MAG: 4Fe-4S binding protein [Thermoguttaceae bacterium]|nr:4Fe-4S binding protein [Thermoguttaceae bacterium]
MAAKVDKDKCVACGACAEACPCGAIEIQDVAVVSDDCAGCGACADACPAEAITVE